MSFSRNIIEIRFFATKNASRNKVENCSRKSTKMFLLVAHYYATVGWVIKSPSNGLFDLCVVSQTSKIGLCETKWKGNRKSIRRKLTFRVNFLPNWNNIMFWSYTSFKIVKLSKFRISAAIYCDFFPPPALSEMASMTFSYIKLCKCCIRVWFFFTKPVV